MTDAEKGRINSNYAYLGKQPPFTVGRWKGRWGKGRATRNGTQNQSESAGERGRGSGNPNQDEVAGTGGRRNVNQTQSEDAGARGRGRGRVPSSSTNY